MLLNFKCPLENPWERFKNPNSQASPQTELNKIAGCAAKSPHIIFKTAQNDSKLQPRLWTTGLENLPSSPIHILKSYPFFNSEI